jgi:hypothetical protein
LFGKLKVPNNSNVLFAYRLSDVDAFRAEVVYFIAVDENLNGLNGREFHRGVDKLLDLSVIAFAAKGVEAEIFVKIYKGNPVPYY